MQIQEKKLELKLLIFLNTMKLMITIASQLEIGTVNFLEFRHRRLQEQRALKS